MTVSTHNVKRVIKVVLHALILQLARHVTHKVSGHFQMANVLAIQGIMIVGTLIAHLVI